MSRQPFAHRESSTLSEINFSPVAFSENQISALVLPLFSGTDKLIWVGTDKIDLPLDVAAELDKVFGRSPYLTQYKTGALAKRCALLPDEVRVWFMLRRLQHGISWDYADIIDVGRKIKSSHSMEELQMVKKKNKSFKSVGKKPDRKRSREVRDDQGTNEENVRGRQGLGRKIHPEQPMQEGRDRKVKVLETDKSNDPKKPKRMTVKDKIRQMRRINAGAVERAEEEMASDEVTMASAKSKSSRSARNRKNNPQKPDSRGNRVRSGFKEKQELDFKVEGEPRASSANPNGTFADLIKVKEDMEALHTVVANIPNRCQTKTLSQQVMLKKAFLTCQYPDNEDFCRLSELIGIPRESLIQWFSDMRYNVKKKSLNWMSLEQRRQALANINYHQCLMSLFKKKEEKPGR